MASGGENYVFALYLDPAASPQVRSELLADFRAMGFKPKGAEASQLGAVVPGIPLVFVRDEGTVMPDGQTMFKFTKELKGRPEVKGIDRRGWYPEPQV